MSELNKLGLAEARDALRRGETTSPELTEACLGAIQDAGALNAFVQQDVRWLHVAVNQTLCVCGD